MKIMLFYAFFCSSIIIVSQNIFAATLSEFNKIKWLDGAKVCTNISEPPINVQQLNEDTFILRESLCIDPEAPFMYLLFGKNKVLLEDTGALHTGLKDSSKFPLQKTVQNIITNWQKKHGNNKLELLVVHSHSHRDHISGDDQFIGIPQTIVVGTTLKDVIQFFGFVDWPNRSTHLDLGSRPLEIIPIPGHENTHIAIYDYKTEILLTGDTLYPGRLYIRDWQQYKKSISTLVEFSTHHPISYVLGTHIEMTEEPYTDFRFEVTDRRFQHSLQLSVAHLLQLNQALQKMTIPKKKAYPDFIIEPV